MDALTLVTILIFAGGALLLILYPLWQSSQGRAVGPDAQAGQTLEEYQIRYEATLAAIKDLMFDHEMGKVSSEDYETLLPKTKIEAAQIRRKIDQLQQGYVESDPILEANLEALVAQLKNSDLSHNSLLADVQADIDRLKQTGGDSQLCPQCDHLVDISDAFCAGCGHPMTDDVPPTADESAASCAKCGMALQPGDAFCAQCGTATEEARPHTDSAHVAELPFS